MASSSNQSHMAVASSPFAISNLAVVFGCAFEYCHCTMVIYTIMAAKVARKSSFERG